MCSILKNIEFLLRYIWIFSYEFKILVNFKTRPNRTINHRTKFLKLSHFQSVSDNNSCTSFGMLYRVLNVAPGSRVSASNTRRMLVHLIQPSQFFSTYARCAYSGSDTRSLIIVTGRFVTYPFLLWFMEFWYSKEHQSQKFHRRKAIFWFVFYFVQIFNRFLF